MFMLPSTLLFTLMITASIFLMSSSPSLLLSWLALELNAMAFIPMILQNKSMKTGESSVKYFLAQTLGSIWILLSIVMPAPSTLWNTLLILGLALKLGAAPFHIWLPSMVPNMSWGILFLLFSIQKINPLIMLLNYEQKFSLLLINLASFSLIVGSVIGLMQTQTRKILAYSSINQMGWLMMSSLFSANLTALFFWLYTTILLPVILSFKSINFNLLKQSDFKSLSYLILTLNLLSLGGLPPFLGFLGKWAVLSSTIYLFPFISFIMIMMSLLTLYFYLRMGMNSYMLTMASWATPINYNYSFILILSSFLSLTGLFLASLLL